MLERGGDLSPRRLVFGVGERGRHAGPGLELTDVAEPETWLMIQGWQRALPLVQDLLNEVEASVGSNTDIEAITEGIQRSEALIEPLLTGLVESATELEAQR